MFKTVVCDLSAVTWLTFFTVCLIKNREERENNIQFKESWCLIIVPFSLIRMWGKIER